MGKIDEDLDRAETQKLHEDPVRLAQAKFAPVRAWAVKEKHDVNKAVAELGPRIHQALTHLNRLTGLMRSPPAEPLRLWEALNRNIVGFADGYQDIVNRIDTLTPYQVGQRVHMLDLESSQNHPPGNISHIVKTLEDLERSLAKFAARLEGSPA